MKTETENNQDEASNASAARDCPASPDSRRTLEELCAIVYARTDWHRLTSTESEIVDRLESSGHLTINNPANGFVGSVSIPLENVEVEHE